MCKHRPLPAHRVIDLALPTAIHQVIIAAHDMCDLHVVIIDHHGEIIGRIAIRAQQDEVIEFLGRPAHRALDRVLEHDIAVGRLETHRERLVGRTVGRVTVAPGRAQGAASRKSLVAQGLDLVGRAPAFEGMPFVEQGIGDLGMALGARKLRNHIAVPVETEPAKPVENCVDCRLGRAGAIGILDAQEELAAMVAGKQPVEQRGAPPIWRKPVGEGAKRVRIILSLFCNCEFMLHCEKGLSC